MQLAVPMYWKKNCATFAQHYPLRSRNMNSRGTISSVELAKEAQPCPQCGSTTNIGGGLCLKCLLYRGLGEDTYDNEMLDSVLDEIDVRDADWRLGNYQILEEIG